MKNLTRYISERFEGFALLGGYLAIAYVAILILAALTAFVASIFISLGALIFNVDLKEGGASNFTDFIFANKGGVYIFFAIPWICVAPFFLWKRMNPSALAAREREQYVQRYWEGVDQWGTPYNWIYDDKQKILGPMDFETGSIMTIERFERKERRRMKEARERKDGVKKGTRRIPWDTWYGLLETYEKEYGHADVPSDYVTTDGYKLGGWVSRQRGRHRRGLVTIDQRVRLDQLDFSWYRKLKSPIPPSIR